MKFTKHDAMVAGGSIAAYKVVELSAKFIYNRFFTEEGKKAAAENKAKKEAEKAAAKAKKEEVKTETKAS